MHLVKPKPDDMTGIFQDVGYARPTLISDCILLQT